MEAILGLITLVLLQVFFLSVSVVGKDQKCSPSSCGDIRNISYPFRLQGDPPNCGYPEYELVCENNRTMINLGVGKYYGKFLVTQIDYGNYTIGVVDHGAWQAKKGKCWTSSPLHSIAAYYYSTPYPYEFPYRFSSQWTTAYYTIVLVNCERAIKDDDYIPIIPCSQRGYYYNDSSSSSSSSTYVYAVVGEYTSVEDIPNSCTIGTYTAIQPLKKRLPKRTNLSMSVLQDYLLLGLRLSFFYHLCDRECSMKGQICFLSQGNAVQCHKRWNNHIPNTPEKNCEYEMPQLIYSINLKLGL